MLPFPPARLQLTLAWLLRRSVRPLPPPLLMWSLGKGGEGESEEASTLTFLRHCFAALPPTFLATERDQKAGWQPPHLPPPHAKHRGHPLLTLRTLTFIPFSS